jgi:serine protease Do
MTPSARGRETRLLLTTLVVSAGMLLILARFRFPERAEPAAPPPAAPLERLAARATYEDLALVLRGLRRQLSGSAHPIQIGDLRLPAIRIAPERAIAFAGTRLGQDGGGAGESAGLLAADAYRGVALFRVDPNVESIASPAGTRLPSPGYAVALEMAVDGPAVRPVYYGRVDPAQDARWDAPLLRFSALQQPLAAGTALFRVDGGFIGLGAPRDDGFVVVPAALLTAAAARLESGVSIVPSTIGAEADEMDERLRAATGAAGGVVVTHVRAGGPAAGALAAGDAIVRIAGRDVRSVRDYFDIVGALPAGTSVTVGVRRRGKDVTVAIVPAAVAPAPPAAADDLGLDMRAVRGEGAHVLLVRPRSAAAQAGLQAGDVITRIDGDDAPSPAAVDAAFRRAKAGASLMLAVRRGARHLVAVVARP